MNEILAFKQNLKMYTQENFHPIPVPMGCTKQQKLCKNIFLKLKVLDAIFSENKTKI